MNSRGIIAFALVLSASGAIVATRLHQDAAPTEADADASPAVDLDAGPGDDAVSVPETDPRPERASPPAPDPEQVVTNDADGLRDSLRAGIREAQPSAQPAPSGIFDIEPRRDVRTQLDQLIAAEADDPDWSTGMESRILSEISQLSGLAASLIEVECRTIHCMIRLTLPPQTTPAQSSLVTRGDNGRFEFDVAEALSLETVAVLALRDDGASVFVAYLKRTAASETRSRHEIDSTA